jgi:S1-C subfamily serine protease
MVKLTPHIVFSSFMSTAVLYGLISGPFSTTALSTSRTLVSQTSRKSIARVAKDVTVLIRGVNNAQNFGSGIIVAKSGKIYTVLTVAHVVTHPDQYTIEATDGTNYPLKNIQKLPDLDIATVQFESSASYSLARPGNSDAIDLSSPAYVAGFPKPGLNAASTTPIFVISRGSFSAILPKNQIIDGRAIAYNAPTRQGMGGGPVFNDAGEVIAIHGWKKYDSSRNVWLNWGIPINRYKSGAATPRAPL